MELKRCGWCLSDPIYIDYHDREWGKPLYEERKLFEMLCLEGQQAGLAWITVLKKREAYYEHFFQYPIKDIAKLTDQQLQIKIQDKNLIRNKAKLYAIRTNAIAWQSIKKQEKDMVKWLWATVDNTPITNIVEDYRKISPYTDLSIQLSKQLQKNGFKFVGPTICYAFMQATGMVNDHERQCSFR